MPDFRAMQQRIDAVLDKDLFFVVGCQKSGTTWLQRLLDGHPELVCQGEGMLASLLRPLLGQAIKGFNQKQAQRNQQLHESTDHLAFDDAQFDHLIRTAAGRLFSQWEGVEQARAVGEKTPEHTLCLETLDRLFPGMKVVHIIRDGRDAAISGWFHNLRKGEAEFRQRFPDLASYVAYFARHHWVGYIERARRFGEAYPQRYVELRYESLHHDAAGELRKALELLGVNGSDDAVQQCIDAGRFEKLSGGRQQGQEDRGSFFRSGRTGDWREHFDERARRAFLQEAGHPAEALGYPDEPLQDAAAESSGPSGTEAGSASGGHAAARG